jgi:putative membrane protein
MAKKKAKTTKKSKPVKLTPEEPKRNGLLNALIWISVNVIALLIVEYILPGFTITNLWNAIVAAIIIGVINTYIRPILQLIALPLSILTLGIFAFLINVFLLMFASWIVPGFEITDFWTAVLASILLTLIGWFFRKISK